MYTAGKWEVSLGRWFLVTLSKIRFGFTTPLWGTFSSIVIISISILFIIDLFNIKNKINKFILALLLLSTPAFAGTLSFYYCSMEYALSMLMSILIPWCAFKIQNKSISLMSSSVLLCLSMGIYQSYIGVAIGLYLIYIIHKFFNSNKNEYTIKELLKDIIYIFEVMAIGFVLYAIISKVTLKLFDTIPANYLGANKVSIINSIKNFPESICDAYKDFFKLFYNPKIIKNSIYYRPIINSILFISIFIIILFKNIKENKYKELIIQLTLLLLSPLAFNIIVFIATEESVKVMMAHGMFMIFVLLIVLLDKYKIKYVNLIATIALIVLIQTYIISMNATYVAWSLIKNQTLTVSEKIIEKIEETGLYNENRKLCIVGRIKINKTNNIYKMTLGDYSEHGFFWSGIQDRSWKSVFNNYFGYDFNMVKSEKQYQKIILNDEFKKMTEFPKEGSIKVIDDIVVVKLENVYN